MGSIANPTPNINYKKLSDDTVNNSAVLVSDSELAGITLLASRTYMIIGSLFYNSQGAADIAINFLFSQNCLGWGDFFGFSTTDSRGHNNLGIDNATTLNQSCAWGGGGATNRVGLFLACVKPSANCTFAVQFAQNAQNVSDTKLLAGSALQIFEV